MARSEMETVESVALFSSRAPPGHNSTELELQNACVATRMHFEGESAEAYQSPSDGASGHLRYESMSFAGWGCTANSCALRATGHIRSPLTFRELFLITQTSAKRSSRNFCESLMHQLAIVKE